MFLEEYTYLSEDAQSLLTSDNKYPIFVVLTDTGTAVSKVIKKFTKDPYNHVSVSFDKDLKTLYSYFIGSGFIEESINRLKNARFSLYVVYVTKQIYIKIKNKIKGFVKNKEKTSYNFGEMVNIIFKKEVFKKEDSMKMLCSEFVNELFKMVGINLFKRKSFIKPYDFINSKLLRFVKRGTIR
jgi:hypothetical protein